MCKTTDYNSPRYCLCSFYVRVNTQNNSHFAYIDYCNLENTSTTKLKYFNSETRNGYLYAYMHFFFDKKISTLTYSRSK